VGLCLIAFFLPLSEYITSAAHFLIIANWLIEFNIIVKLRKLIKNKSILVFLFLFLVPVIWLINSKNLGFAFRDLQIKLPLLALPIVIGTSDSLSKNKINWIVKVFIAGVLISTLAGLFSYFGMIKDPKLDNVRNLSVFVSHIRLSLMICLSVLSIFYFIHEKIIYKAYMIIIASLIIVWLVGFLVMIQGFTGLSALIVIGLLALAIKTFKEKRKILKIIYAVVLFGIPITIFGYMFVQIRTFYTPTIDQTIVRTQTINGNLYYNDVNSKLRENGNLIYREICDKELYAEWNKRSQLSLDGKDLSEQDLLQTLIRYLTSKGLTKDAIGMSEMSDKDIRNVENGVTNYRFVQNGGINQRVYNIIWQIDVYAKGGNPSGHSLTQRIEYLKAGLILAHNNFWFGTGTGDIDDVYKEHYIIRRSQLESVYRHRAHNQYLTFFVSFGVLGALLCFIGFFYPILIEFSSKNFYFAVFILIAMLSMLTDDTLETTTGVVFIGFFYSLFLWGEK
jgi:O-antigen ligase